MPLPARAWVALQYLLPQHAITALVHRLTRVRTRWLRRWLIHGFLRLHAVALDEAEEPDPDRYATFNEFFTRALRAGARPVAAGDGELASPCDGTVSQRGAIEGEQLLQARLAAKNRVYTLTELLCDAVAARDFVAGDFATIYLAPGNYHRVHVPFAGRLCSVGYVPGRLFSVSETTTGLVPRLFARNERVVCRFDTVAGPLAVILVGALNVGSIAIVGLGDLTPRQSRRPQAFAIPAAMRDFARGAELGRFNMGSTVILLLPRGRCEWAGGFGPGATVRMGAPIGRLRS
jgi:phosphatidylserine decarboxylase